MPDTADVVVVGAGAIGCSVAYYLAREGASVVLLDREAIGSGASAHATGSNSLLGAEFNPGPSFQLALESFRMFPQLVPQLQDDTGIDMLFQRRPSLRLSLEEDEERLIRDLMTWQHEFVSMRWIDGDEVRRLEPRLSTEVRGAVYEDESTQLDSYRLTLALAGAAERHGARVLLRRTTGLKVSGSRVTGVHTSGEGIDCGTVVLAMGAWSSEFVPWLGFDVPVRPLKGERLLLQYDAPPLPVLISSPKRGHMISRLDGLMSVGSTGGRDYDQADLFLGEEFDRVPTEAARSELIRRALDVLPDLERASVVHHLAGSRPLSADRMPLIGPVLGWDGVQLATGHGTKGIHLAPVTGRVVADYILRGESDVPVEMAAFLPSRFADANAHDYGEASRLVEE